MLCSVSFMLVPTVLTFCAHANKIDLLRVDVAIAMEQITEESARCV
jgi:hypothetical protein